MSGVQVSLTTDEAGNLRLCPAGLLPRLERALAQSAAAGMLDLVRFGLPAGASPLMSWLQEQARRRLMALARALRRGDADPAAALRVSGEEAARLLVAMPPLYGAAVGAAQLQAWFEGLPGAVERAAQRECCSASEWLGRLGEGWRQLGALCFHLAENAGEGAEGAPFAFLATFVHRAGADGKPRHAPLGLAAQLCAGDAPALAALLRPLRALAEQSAFFHELINSRAVYRPCGWSARQAYAFLEALPLVEAAGIEVRMVNLWKSLPPRAELQVQLDPAEGGGKENRAPALNIGSLLRFVPQVALGDRCLTPAELEELLAGEEDGLVRFRGEWVRLDRTKLQQLLESWRQAARMAAGGIPLTAGLRWLLAPRSQRPAGLPEGEARVVAGPLLAPMLSRLCFCPREPLLPSRVAALLRPYQREGVRFLLGVTEAGFGACLADDMGLGKTLQVIAWLLHLQAAGALQERAALVVAPASLLENWREELARFAPQLRVRLLHPYALSRSEQEQLRLRPEGLLGDVQVALTTYGMLTRLAEPLAGVTLPALVLDEAQAIKNSGSARARSARLLSASRRIALTGTPVENNLMELKSLLDFLNPGLLGGDKEFTALLSAMGHDYTPLRRLVRPFMLRRLKSDPALLPELPPKTEQPAWCYLTPLQTKLYAREVEGLRAVAAEPDPALRLSLVLPVLGRLKQICNHPAQYAGESWYDPAASGKWQQLEQLARRIAAAGEAVLVFTQYRRLIEPLHDDLAGIFGREGLVLHGGMAPTERQAAVRAFQQAGGPPFMVLSLRAAGTGLTLTRARHVIHFDRWWNPAVENQASDRAYRIGQKNPVVIHPMMCRGTIEQNIHRMLADKRAMADALLAGGMEKLLLHLSPQELLELVGTPPQLPT